MFSTFLGFGLVILLFKMTFQHNAEVLVGVPRCRRGLMGLTGKVRVLDKLLLLRSYSTIGLEFNVNESTVHIK